MRQTALTLALALALALSLDIRSVRRMDMALALAMTVLPRRVIVVCDRPAHLMTDNHLLGIIARDALRCLIRIRLGNRVVQRGGGFLMGRVDYGVAAVTTTGSMVDRGEWVVVGNHGVPGAGFAQRVEAVAAALGAHGTFAGVRGGVAPARVAGDHEGFEAGDGAGDDAVVFLDLHPNGCHHGVKSGIGRDEFNVQVVQAEDDECNNPG